MQLPFDGAIVLLITAGLNIVNTVMNFIYSLRMKSVQVNKELLTSLTEQLKTKDEIIADKEDTIKEMKDAKDKYKHQYNQLLVDNNRLEGELKGIKATVKAQNA